MTSGANRLIAPSFEYRAQFLAMAAEFHAAGELDWPHGAWSGDRLALDDFPAYLRRCVDEARGINLPAGDVPTTTYWLLQLAPRVARSSRTPSETSPSAQEPAPAFGLAVAPGAPTLSSPAARTEPPAATPARLLGTLQLRHTLNDYLEYEGGHFGYCIRPTERGKGYAKTLLRLALAEARQLGLARVLVTCTTTNAASAAVIRACGGVLEDERVSRRHPGEIVQRYWIAL